MIFLLEDTSQLCCFVRLLLNPLDRFWSCCLLSLPAYFCEFQSLFTSWLFSSGLFIFQINRAVKQDQSGSEPSSFLFSILPMASGQLINYSWESYLLDKMITQGRAWLGGCTLGMQLAPCGFSDALSLCCAPHRNSEMKLPPWKPSTMGNPSLKPEWTSTSPGSAWSITQGWQDLWLVRALGELALYSLSCLLSSLVPSMTQDHLWCRFL